jgi:tetratricopeptide (TPR) repeat protein
MTSLRDPAVPFLAIFLWAACVIVFPGSGRSSQTDPRLPGLFQQLARVSSEQDARRLEGEIWGIWNESGSQDVDRLLIRGTQALNQGNLDEAIRIFSEAIEQAPNFSEGWNKRATAHYQLGNYEASIRDVEVTLRLEPHHFVAISGMGLIYSEMGADAPALHWFERALEVHPFLRGLRSRVSELRRKLERSQI